MFELNSMTMKCESMKSKALPEDSIVFALTVTHIADDRMRPMF